MLTSPLFANARNLLKTLLTRGRITVLSTLTLIAASLLTGLSSSPAQAFYLYAYHYTDGGVTYSYFIRSVVKNGGTDDSAVIDVCSTTMRGPRGNNCLGFKSLYTYSTYSTVLTATESGYWNGDAIYQGQTVNLNGRNSSWEKYNLSGYNYAEEVELPWTAMTFNRGTSPNGEPFYDFTTPYRGNNGDGEVRGNYVGRWSDTDAQWSAAIGLADAIRDAKYNYNNVALNTGLGLGWTGLVGIAAKYGGYAGGNGTQRGTAILGAILPVFFFAGNAASQAWSYFHNVKRAAAIYDSKIENLYAHDEF